MFFPASHCSPLFSGLTASQPSPRYQNHGHLHCLPTFYHPQTHLCGTLNLKKLKSYGKNTEDNAQRRPQASALAIPSAGNTLPVWLVLWCPPDLSANAEKPFPHTLSKPPPQSLCPTPLPEITILHYDYLLFTRSSIRAGTWSTFLPVSPIPREIPRQSLTQQIIKKYVFKTERKYDSSSI